MSAEMDALVAAFDHALARKQEGKFDNSDIQKIFDAANKLFAEGRPVDRADLIKIRDKWVALAEGKIDNARAMKKLQGTSRAEAIQSVLKSL